MDKVLSQEERIRRAEEIYNRRKNENNYYTRTVTKLPSRNSTKIKYKMVKKMIVQVCICTIIYFAIYIVKNSEQFFSKEFIEKTKTILAYDISFGNLSEKYFKNIKESINNIFANNIENEKENTKDETDTVENKDEKNLNGEENNIQNTEQNNIEENNQNINSQESGMGGAIEETSEIKEETKSQEEIDIEYVKTNFNIIWPIQGTVTSRFGTRTATQIVTANHYGIDIARNTGTDIIAAMDGTVTISSSEGDYGKHIKIENGDVATLYAHCSLLCVKEGDVVKQGEKIAEVGETGRATGPHLHFEIRRENRFLNPEYVLGSI